MRFIATSLLGAAMLASAAVAVPARADEADFYRGRAVSIVIGNSVGGGYDLYARLLGRHLSRHIPGEPAVTPVNMTGGGGFKMANYLANAAPKDGTWIGIVPPSIALEPLFGDPNAKFTPMGFPWLGNMSRDVSSCYVSARSAIRSFDELAERELSVGATGPAAQSATHAYVLRNLAGAKVKVITGYRGTNDIRMAMEKGEVDGMCGFWLSAALGAQARQLKDGEVRVLVQLGLKKEPVFGAAPHIFDYAKTAEDRQALELVFGMTELNRPFAAAPGTPPARVALLRKAFMDAVRDPALVAEAAKINLMLEPIDGAATEALFGRLAAASPAVVKRATAIIRR